MAKTKEMTKVENKPKTTKKLETLEELTKERDALILEVEDTQKKLSEATYGINFDNIPNITRVMKHIDKNTKWTIKDAALTINLYDNLKLEKARIKAEETKEVNVMLNSLDLNSLYKSLTTCEGYGIETAKTFLTLLTNLGSQISNAMQEMTEANKEVQTKHVALGELDKAIEDMSTEKVEADEVIE